MWWMENTTTIQKKICSFYLYSAVISYYFGYPSISHSTPTLPSIILKVILWHCTILVILYLLFPLYSSLLLLLFSLFIPNFFLFLSIFLNIVLRKHSDLRFVSLLPPWHIPSLTIVFQDTQSPRLVVLLLL